MPRTKSTLYTPLPGMRYIIKSTKSNECIIGKVLTASDTKKFGDIRSSKRSSERFFSVIVNNNIIKFNNNIANKECVSYCKNWKFENEIYKNDNMELKNKLLTLSDPSIEFIDQLEISKITKG